MSERLDAGKLRSLLYRLSAIQGSLVLAILVIVILEGAQGKLSLLLLWLAVLPVLVSGVAYLYYTRVTGLARAGGYSRAEDARLTKEAYRHLGAGIVAWGAVLAAIYFL